MKVTMNARQAIAITILLLCSAKAQSEGVLDIEYVPKASGYESALGVGYYQIKDDGLGVYGNIQLTLMKREPMYENLSVSSFGDPVTERYKDLIMGNVGITKNVTPSFVVYAGVGYASAAGVARKYDPLGILGGGGTYYVNDPQNDKSGANLNAGIIFVLDKLALNIGYNSFTSSAFFGIGGRF